MPDSVKDLTVRLAFEHGDTKSQIAAIKNEIKLLDSGFKAAALEAGGLSSSMDNAAAKSANLQQKIALMEQAISKYGQAIDRAKEKLAQAQQRQQDYTQKLANAKQRQSELTQEIDRVKAAMDASKAATGENTEEYASLSEELEGLQNELKSTNNEIKTCEQGLTRASTSINSADQEVQRLTTAQNEARAAVAGMRTEMASLNDTAEQHRQRLEAAGKAMQQYGEHLKSSTEWQTKLGKDLSKVSATIVSAGVAATGTAIQWETSMADVRKTVSGTAEQLDTIEAGLMEMSQTKPIDNTTLADIAANAGQLGIWTDNVLGFTNVMSDLANTTNLTADEGAAAFARFANVTGMAQTDFDRLGSTVVQLGNNTATTEKDIVAMGTNLASAGHQIGMSEAEIMGISAALSSLGLEAQAGGTAFSKMFVNMKVAAETGSKDLKTYAEVAGMSAAEFKKAFEEDAAGAITAFISGLGSGSKSAIVMLDEMGIKETRFRDALLRTSNASELFSNSIQMANDAWRENSALANEAAVRYGTTASKMTMVGNKAKAAAVKFGQSLLPVVSEGVDWVTQLLDKFNALDEGQRKQILTWGAYIAAVGPAILLIGKANSGIAAFATGMGKFTSSIAAAGGGLKGLLGAVGGLLGPAGIAALAAGAAVLAYKFVDWASGAKAAREATKALNDEAKNWMETQAQTLYDTGTGDPLAKFGLSKDDFAGSGIKAAKTWRDNLIAVWTDGKKETTEIVKEFTEGFTTGSDDIRKAIKDQSDLLDDYDVMTPGAKKQLDDDLALLDSWDKEVEQLLKKRQNGFLTEQEQARLDQIITQRAEIEMKYSLDTDSGYEEILSQMEAAIERAEHGGRVDATLFGDTLNALAEGRKAYMDALDDSYDAEYRQIQLIQDEAARTAALDELNQRFNERRITGEEAYADSVKAAGKAAWENGSYTDQIQQLYDLAGMLGDKNNINIPSINDFIGADDFDEGKLTSMIALVEQLKAAGFTNEEMATMGIDYDAIMNLIEQIRDVAGSTEGLEGVADIFGKALPDEIQRIMIGLDMTQAAEDWAAFAEGGSLTKIKAGVELADTTPIDLSGNITQLATKPGVKFTADGDGNITSATTADGVTFTADGDGNITSVTADGVTFTVDGSGNVTSVTMPTGETIDLSGNITQVAPQAGLTFTVDGTGNVTSVTTPTGETIDLSGNITSITADGVTFTADGDGNITSATTADGVTFTADGDGNITSVTADGVTFTVDGDGNITSVTADGVTFTADGDGNITSVTADGVTFSGVEGSGEITKLTMSSAVSVPAAPGVTASITLTPLDQTAISAWEEKNADKTIEGPKAKVGVKLGANWATTLKDTYDAGMLEVWGADGAKLDVTPEVLNAITAEDVAMYDKDGTLHVIVTPVIGSQEGVEFAEQGYENKPLANTALSWLTESTHDVVKDANEQAGAIAEYRAELEKLKAEGQDTSYGEDYLSVMIGDFVNTLGSLSYRQDDIDAISQMAANLMTALSSGDLDPETAQAYAAQLQEILDLVGSADEYMGEGNEISAGIAEGMNEYGWQGDATTLKDSIQSAINTALGIASPAKTMIPVGDNVAAGIAQGMTEYAFAAAAASVMGGITGAFGRMRGEGQGIGDQFGAGLAGGLRARLPGIVAEAKRAADEIAAAFRDAWQIHSPSKVAEGLTDMFGRGLEKGMDKWPTVSERLLEQDLDALYNGTRRGSSAGVGGDTNTYNNSAALSFAGANFYVRDQQDVQSLAVDIATLTRRKQHGKGLRAK